MIDLVPTLQPILGDQVMPWQNVAIIRNNKKMPSVTQH